MSRVQTKQIYWSLQGVSFATFRLGLSSVPYLLFGNIEESFVQEAQQAITVGRHEEFLETICKAIKQTIEEN